MKDKQDWIYNKKEQQYMDESEKIKGKNTNTRRQFPQKEKKEKTATKK